MAFEFFDLVSGVDECFICIKRLENLIDGAFVSYLSRLCVCVCVCLVCEAGCFRVCHHPSIAGWRVCVF